ncbi:MAG: acetylglutamate kinase [Candidatus Hydrogenedentota bacterium]
MLDKCEAIIEALPYFRKFAGKTIVIKYGGSAQVEPELRTGLCQDLVLMQTLGIPTVLIHGGGPEISGMMKRLGKTAQFIEGLRVTDEETAEITEMVLVGKINKALAAEINLAGGRAVGLSGRDGNLVRAVKVKPVSINGEEFDLGHVGTPEKIDPTILSDLLRCGYIPVVAPTGMAPDGKMLNINGDTVASYIAGALAAEKLIFLTDQKGVLRDVKDADSCISQLTLSGLEALESEGIATGGMIPKIQAARIAIESDVKGVHIIDGRIPHSIILELFTSAGVGTMITRNQGQKGMMS